ncbi:MAG TPA: hypothetical protein GXX64_06710 [Bacteroidales bacterium]|jgi:hypothetical protein|nr:hypothetical protein [Bacteroidales bacterium]
MKFTHLVILTLVVLLIGSIVLENIENNQTSEKIKMLWESVEERSNNIDPEKQSIAEIKADLSAIEMYLIEIIELESRLNVKTNKDKQIRDIKIKYAELELEAVRAMNTDFISLYQHLKEADAHAERNNIVNARIEYKNALNDLIKLKSKMTNILARMRDLNLEPLDTEMQLEIKWEIIYLEESIHELESMIIDLQEIVDSGCA